MTWENMKYPTWALFVANFTLNQADAAWLLQSASTSFVESPLSTV
jgi:hypothetical protein